MKILIVSDTHGNRDRLCELFRSSDFDAVMFLGDVVRDADALAVISGHIPVYKVSGNCDFFAPNVYDELLLDICSHRFFITHGHKYGVKNGYGIIENAARKKGADIVLFGHTHVAFYENRDGLIMINPGAFVNGKYGILTVSRTNGEICYKNGDIYD